MGERRGVRLRFAKQPLTGDLLFAWALGAPYHVPVGYPVDGLDPGHRAGSWRLGGMISRRLSKIGLANSWGVRDRADLFEAMEHLGPDGHRHDNRRTLGAFLSLDPEHRAELRTEAEAEAAADAAAEGPKRLLWLLDLSGREPERLRGAPLLGFDAARGAMLAREGLIHGWFRDEEVRGYLLALAAETVETFGSWEEFGRDFLLSRAMWEGKETPETDPYARAVNLLLGDEASPWRRVPWGVSAAPSPWAVPGAPAWRRREESEDEADDTPPPTRAPRARGGHGFR